MIAIRNFLLLLAASMVVFGCGSAGKPSVAGFKTADPPPQVTAYMQLAPCDMETALAVAKTREWASAACEALKAAKAPQEDPRKLAAQFTVRRFSSTVLAFEVRDCDPATAPAVAQAGANALLNRMAVLYRDSTGVKLTILQRELAVRDGDQIGALQVMLNYLKEHFPKARRAGDVRPEDLKPDEHYQFESLKEQLAEAKALAKAVRTQLAEVNKQADHNPDAPVLLGLSQ